MKRIQIMLGALALILALCFISPAAGSNSELNVEAPALGTEEYTFDTINITVGETYRYTPSIYASHESEIRNDPTHVKPSLVNTHSWVSYDGVKTITMNPTTSGTYSIVISLYYDATPNVQDAMTKLETSIMLTINVMEKSQTKYTLTYNANGGSSTPASVTLNAGSKTTLAGYFGTKSGYTFSNYLCTNSSGTGTKYQAGTEYTLNSNVTLYAIWTANSSGGGDDRSYTVTYNKNGGSGYVPGSAVTDSNGRISLPSADLIKDGYYQSGWNTKSDGSGTHYAGGSIITVSSNITLYAEWSKVQYTVTFNSNEGSSVPSQSVGYQEKATKPSDPAREGYEFTGWYSDSELTTEYDFNSQVTANIALYAKWTPLPSTITLDTDVQISSIETSNGAVPVTNNTFQTLMGSTVTLPSPSPKLVSGWCQVVTGWRDSAGNSVGFEYTVSSLSETLTPVWHNYFRVTVEGAKATVEIDSAFSPYKSHRVQWGDGETTTVNNLASMVTHEYLANATYTVVLTSSGWSKNQTGTYGISVSGVTGGSTAHIVNFETNGGSDVPSQTVAEGKTVSKPEDPTKLNFTFGGWYVNAEFTSPYDFNSPVTANIALYAKWNEKGSYTVNFETNGGSETASQTVAGDTKLVKPEDPTKDGFKFAGWYTDKELKNVFDFDSTVIDNLTLYAKWNEGSSAGSDYKIVVYVVIAIIVFILACLLIREMI